MDTSFTPAQEALRRELADYMARLMTPELRAELALPWGAEGGGPLWRAALRQMGQDGWIGLGWPREWGGRGLGPVEQYIFIEEVTRSGFSFPYLTPESVGPAIAEFGTDEIEQRVLPGILGGELVMAIGYTEPQAGTDLAALKTRAVRDGEHYVINGQKVFTSLAHLADYVFLAVRRRSRDALAPQGHLDPAGADRQPRLLAHADPHRRGGRDQRHLLRQRARAGQPPGRARERELEGHHPPADQRLDRGLWRQLKESGLAAPGLPEAQGGAGLGFFETCLTLEQLGRTVAAVPLAGHAVGLLALHGPAVQTVSDALAADDAWLACSARTDAGNTLRVQDGRLHGSLSAVPFAEGARLLLLPSRSATGWRLCLLDPAQPGVRFAEQATTALEPCACVHCEGAAVQLLDDDGRVEWLNERLMVATCAVQTGVLEEMLAMTTRYVAGRERFGAPIGSFQSVSHRLADAGHRVSASCQHVHGGIGHDRDYPLWRYAIRARHNELLHGGASQAQAALGAAIARAPAAAAL